MKRYKIVEMNNKKGLCYNHIYYTNSKLIKFIICLCIKIVGNEYEVE